MAKNFDDWNEKKKKLDKRIDSPFFHEREVRWCSLGANIGAEQDGSGKNYYRPVLILRGMSRSTCFAIPLTTSEHKHTFRPSVGLVDGKEARALLSQMKLMDSKRLISKMGYLSEEIFMDIRKAAKDML